MYTSREVDVSGRGGGLCGQFIGVFDAIHYGAPYQHIHHHHRQQDQQSLGFHEQRFSTHKHYQILAPVFRNKCPMKDRRSQSSISHTSSRLL